MNSDRFQEAWEHDPASLCGELLGEGGTRTVYACAFADDTVIKVGCSTTFENHLFSENVSEMLFCQHASEEMLALVARAVWISPDGRYLAAQRAKGPAPIMAFRSVPFVLAGDLQISNWGVLDGRFVAVDYPYALWNAIGAALKLGNVPAVIYNLPPFRALEAQCRALSKDKDFADNPKMVSWHLQNAEHYARQAEALEQSMREAASELQGDPETYTSPMGSSDEAIRGTGHA